MNMAGKNELTCKHLKNMLLLFGEINFQNNNTSSYRLWILMSVPSTSVMVHQIGQTSDVTHTATSFQCYL